MPLGIAMVWSPRCRERTRGQVPTHPARSRFLLPTARMPRVRVETKVDLRSARALSRTVAGERRRVPSRAVGRPRGSEGNVLVRDLPAFAERNVLRTRAGLSRA